MAVVELTTGDDRAARAANPSAVTELVAATYEAALLPERWAQFPNWIAHRLGATSGALRRRDGLAETLSDISEGCRATIAFPAASNRSGAADWVLTLGGFADGTSAAVAQQYLVALHPHLGSAVGIAYGQALHEARVTVAALDRVGAGAAIVDDAGRVVAANARFSVLLGLIGEPVGMPMRLDQRRDVASLKAVLPLAIAGGERGAVPIHDADGRCIAALHLLPIRPRDGHDGSRPGGVTALVLVATPQAAGLPSPVLLKALFGLTRTEAAIALAIAAGDAIERIAQTSATSVETVRSHLKHIFSKTSTTRQLELALLVRGFGVAGDAIA